MFNGTPARSAGGFAFATALQACPSAKSKEPFLGEHTD